MIDKLKKYHVKHHKKHSRQEEARYVNYKKNGHVIQFDVRSGKASIQASKPPPVMKTYVKKVWTQLDNLPEPVILKRKIVRLVEEAKHEIDKLKQPVVNEYRPPLRPSRSLSSIFSFAENKTKATQTTPKSSIKSKHSNRSLTNLPKDRLNEKLLTASIQKEVDQMIESEKFKVSNCRQSRASYDRQEIRDFMLKKALLRKQAQLEELKNQRIPKKNSPSAAKSTEPVSKARIVPPKPSVSPSKKEKSKEEIANFLFTRRNKLELQSVPKEVHAVNDDQKQTQTPSPVMATSVPKELHADNDDPKQTQTAPRKMATSAPLDLQSEVSEIVQQVLSREGLPNISIDLPNLLPDDSSIFLDSYHNYILAPLNASVVFEKQSTPKHDDDSVLNRSFQDSLSLNNKRKSPTKDSFRKTFFETINEKDELSLSDEGLEGDRVPSPLSIISSLDCEIRAADKTFVQDSSLLNKTPYKTATDFLDDIIPKTPKNPARVSFDQIWAEIMSSTNKLHESRVSEKNQSSKRDSRSLLGDLTFEAKDKKGTADSSCISVYVQPDREQCVSCFLDSEESSAASVQDNKSPDSDSSNKSGNSDFDADFEPSFFKISNDSERNISPSKSDKLYASLTDNESSITERINQITNKSRTEKQETIKSSLVVGHDSQSHRRNQSDLFKLTSDIDLDFDENDDGQALDDDTDNISSIHSELSPSFQTPFVLQSKLPSNLKEGKQTCEDTHIKSVDELHFISTPDKIDFEFIDKLLHEFSAAIMSCQEKDTDDWKLIVLNPNKKTSPELTTYKKFYCDLIDHILKEIFRRKEVPPSAFKTIHSMAKYAKRLPFPSNTQDLHKNLLDKICQILHIRSREESAKSKTRNDVKTEGLVGLFKSSVRRDFIDRVVLEEIVEESPEWLDFSAQTTAIIDHLSQDLYEDILHHFVQNETNDILPDFA